MGLLNRDRYAQKLRAREPPRLGAFRELEPSCRRALEGETLPEKAGGGEGTIAQGLQLPGYSVGNPGL